MDQDRPRNDAPAWGAGNPHLAGPARRGPASGDSASPTTPSPDSPGPAAFGGRPVWPPEPQAAPPAWAQQPAPAEPAPAGWISAAVPPSRQHPRRGIAGYIAVAVATSAISAAIAFSGGVVVGAGVGANVSQELAATGPIPSASTKPGDPPGFGLFGEAWGVLKQNYVDPKALDSKDITYGAIRGMTAAIGDTDHTRFMTPDELKQEQQGLSGTFAGIGAVLSQEGADLVVQSVLQGAPAQRAGVRAGDRILAVDGKETTGKTVSEVVSEVRGPEGTAVTLTLGRDGEPQPIVITITRATITSPAVSWALYPGTTTAVVRLEQFSADSGKQLTDALKAAEAAGATKIVLDLRNDPGGYVGEAMTVASQFLKDGLVFIQQDGKGVRKENAVQPGGAATTQPLVVLVDGQSASSAEIVAGAIQDGARGTIVGVKTFGTGTVLSEFDLSDGSALYVGTSQWLTPKGHEIWKRGIAPDVVVTLPSDGRLVVPDEFSALGVDGIVKAGDTQLIRAVQLLAQE